jgi:L-alanine-DL-glutamate epimerase-like enolase superfamily enzyme
MTLVDRAALRIVSIETVAVRVPLSHRYSGSAYSMDNRCTIVTRLETANGLVSEVYNGDTDEEQERVVAIIHDELYPLIAGLTAADPEGVWRAMLPATRNILRDRGLALQAMACIDTAVWDLFGKALGEPLFRVWGALRDELPISVIGGYYHVPRGEIASLLAGYRDQGFAACKFKIGGADVATDALRVAEAREGAGDDFELMVDANQGYSVREAVELAGRIRPLRIRWFEEPCRWENDRLGMRDVRLAGGVAVCAGQSETTLAGLRDLLVAGAIDVSNFDASWVGGPTLWRKAAGLCEAFGVELGHHEEPQIAAHLLASVPAATFVECFEEGRDPLFWNIQTSRPTPVAGRLRISEKPGFGIELDWAYVDRYASARRRTRAAA